MPVTHTVEADLVDILFKEKMASLDAMKVTLSANPLARITNFGLSRNTKYTKQALKYGINKLDDDT
jgi:hypothetical protein